MSDLATIDEQLDIFLKNFNDKFDGRATLQNLHDMIADQLTHKVFNHIKDYFNSTEPLDMIQMLRKLGERIDTTQKAEEQRLEEIKMQDPVYRKKMKNLKKAVEAVQGTQPATEPVKVLGLVGHGKKSKS